MKLKMDLQNCYGIGSLNYEIDYTNNNIAVIYAPNGTMKTSLAKTITQKLAGKDPCDDFYPARPSSASITIDGTPITKENTYVFQNEDTADGSKQISTFLANAALKREYDVIYNQLDAAKRGLKRKIKNLAQSSDCEEEILETFKTSDEDNFFDCLLLIEPQLADRGLVLEYDFRFNDVFDKKDTKVKDFINENQDTIQAYFNKYNELLTTSSFFSAGPDSFGTTHANALLKSVGDNRFFLASHKFVLKGNQEVNTKEDMAGVIQAEINRILTDDEIKRLFTTLDEKLQKNEKLKGFKEVIQTYPELIPELLDYDGFQKKILRGYLSRNLPELSIVNDIYKAHKDELKGIVNRANGERSEWERVILLFNTRFFVPFTLDLQNKSDILLNAKAPELQFMYHDGGETAIKQERKTLMEHLSTGEKKAFIILQNIFELEARRANHQQTLLVFDDLADSFDYKNKYAIIEYLYDLKKDGIFKMLILTHNFDFYRTAVSRLDGGGNVFFADKQDDRSVKMCQGIYNADILKSRMLKKMDERRAFIGCVPFIRNIVEYTDEEGNKSKDYKELTNCLHLKDETPGITFNDIIPIFQQVIKSSQGLAFTFGVDNYLDALFKEADAIMTDPNEVDIVNKLVLSIAIRMKAEQYMVSVLSAEQVAEIRPNKRNRTAELLNIMKKYHGVDMEDECRMMNKVLMLTSENIHFNNFMFEPLVDISIQHLKQLYNDVKALLAV